MLENIYRKGYLKIDEISQELGMPKSLVEQMIQELKNKEYLKIATPLEEAAVSFCPLKSKCHIKTAGIVRSYILTEKAKNCLKYKNNPTK